VPVTKRLGNPALQFDEIVAGQFASLKLALGQASLPLGEHFSTVIVPAWDFGNLFHYNAPHLLCQAYLQI
jgi:hypothetical protein